MVRRKRGEGVRPEGDLKLKLPRFRLDEFISLAGKIARGASRTGSRFLWIKWRSFAFATEYHASFLHSLISFLKYNASKMHPKIIKKINQTL